MLRHLLAAVTQCFRLLLPRHLAVCLRRRHRHHRQRKQLSPLLAVAPVPGVLLGFGSSASAAVQHALTVFFKVGAPTPAALHLCRPQVEVAIETPLLRHSFAQALPRSCRLQNRVVNKFMGESKQKRNECPVKFLNSLRCPCVSEGCSWVKTCTKCAKTSRTMEACPALRSALPLSKLQCRQLSLLKTGVSYSFTTDALTGQKLFIQVANVHSRFTVFYGNRN